MKSEHTIKRNGFTLIEILLALVILATLMAAVGLAFDASVTNYHANRGIHKTLNTARQALTRMTTDLRTSSGIPATGEANTQVSLFTSAGDNITYRYDNTDNTLYYDDNTTSNNYALCKNVTALTINRATVPGDPTTVRSVRIILTVTDDLGEVTQTLAAGVVVRKSL